MFIWETCYHIQCLKLFIMFQFLYFPMSIILTSSSCVLQSKEQTKKQKEGLLISENNLKLPPKAKLHQALYIYIYSKIPNQNTDSNDYKE